MKNITLTKGKVALVDDADFEFLNQWKWCASQAGRNLFYAERVDTSGGGRIKIKMHRLLLCLSESHQVDHIDRNGLNNQISNLRFATQSMNGYNRRKNSNNTSGFRGVDWNKQRNKWRARVSLGKGLKSLHLGFFDSPQDAAKSYDDAILGIAGEFAATNKTLGLL